MVRIKRASKEITMCVIFFLVVGAFLPGCHDDPLHPQPPVISNNSDGMVPLKVGNEWIYRYFMYDTSGNEIATFLDTVAVERDTIIGNERWYRVPRLKPADADFFDFYTNRIDGLWVLQRVIGPNSDTAFSYLTFKYPTQPGDSWGNFVGDSTRTSSIAEIIITPSGTDTCIKYEDHFQLYPTDSIIFWYYFKPGKGWVMFEIYSTTGSGRQYLLNRLILINATNAKRQKEYL